MEIWRKVATRLAQPGHEAGSPRVGWSGGGRGGRACAGRVAGLGRHDSHMGTGGVGAVSECGGRIRGERFRDARASSALQRSVTPHVTKTLIIHHLTLN
jgi:hypothetical protein